MFILIFHLHCFKNIFIKHVSLCPCFMRLFKLIFLHKKSPHAYGSDFRLVETKEFIEIRPELQRNLK